jgi:hypothetical protein
VEYEKLKFQEFLSTVDDGLVATREWLVSFPSLCHGSDS